VHARHESRNRDRAAYPAVFSAAFARRLNELCALEVKEATDGDEIVPERALVAPGDRT